MLKLIKLIFIKWIVPPGFRILYKRAAENIRLRKLGLSTIRINRSLRDLHKGSRCFILGSGPSIRDLDVKSLQNEHVFVMSTFYNHPEFELLNPHFHSCVKLPPSISTEEKNLVLKAMSDNVLPESTIFLNLAQKAMVEEHGYFSRNKVYYIATRDTQRSFDLSRVTREHRTNGLQTLELALYMGFTEIYLHGMDLDTACKQVYEYGFENQLAVADPGKNENNVSNRIQSELFSAAALSYREFEDIAEYAQNHNRRIINLNPEGMLNMFPREDIQNIL